MVTRTDTSVAAVAPFAILVSLLWLTSGCAWLAPQHEHAGFAYKDLPVATGTADAGDGHSVTFKGTPLALEGPGLKVGGQLPSVKVSRHDLSVTDLAEGRGKVRLISVVPSLDTKVCEQQTHYLSEKNGGLDQSVQLITISVDTPFAQSRFSDEAAIKNVMFLSDYRGGGFGKASGLFLPGPHLLARAVLVVDKDNVVRYLQVTPELAQMPDMDAAFQAARATAGGR